MATAPTVFVSYSRQDFYFAEQLAVALRQHGIAAWFDAHQLAPGTDWSAAIDQAIQDCEALVLVASPAALGSPNVRSECDRALELRRPIVAVHCRAVTLPQTLNVPSYDLRRSFGHGAAALADDLTTHRRAGRPPLRWPLATGPLLVALAPALSLLSVVVLGLAFLQTVIGHQLAAGRTATLATIGTVTILGLAAGVALYMLTAFLRRTISWRYLRGSLVSLPLLALAGAVEVNLFAAVLTNPIAAALGDSGGMPLGAAPTILALLVLPACVAAGIATEFSAGVCRLLRTGAAPPRIRARHVGSVSLPSASHRPEPQCRIWATPLDAAIARQLSDCLATVSVNADVNVSVEQVTDSDPDPHARDIVIVSDATPAEWLTRADLRDPIAVVVTSVSLPLHGVLGRFQWVDHRRRHAKTLRQLTADLAEANRPAGPARQPLPEVPERLQTLRLPVWVAATEWMLFSLGVIAAQVGAFGWTRVALDGWGNAPWQPCLCVAVAIFPFLLAGRLRRRQLTLFSLTASIAVFWAVVVALGADAVFQTLYPFYDRGTSSTVTIIYPVVSALLLAAAAHSLLGWLPKPRTRGAHSKPKNSTPTLGTVSGSWVWLAIMLPALGTTIMTAILAT